LYGHIEDINPGFPLQQRHSSWNYLTRNRSSVYFRGIQFNQAARGNVQQEMTCDMPYETKVTLVL
jgi:hypothetical protein